jgi:hypothetical protein
VVHNPGDFIGDVTLICAPIIILYNANLQRGPRRLVYSVFAASIMVCLASVALHTFVLGPSEWEPGKGQLLFVVPHVGVRLFHFIFRSPQLMDLCPGL